MERFRVSRLSQTDCRTRRFALAVSRADTRRPTQSNSPSGATAGTRLFISKTHVIEIQRRQVVDAAGGRREPSREQAALAYRLLDRD